MALRNGRKGKPPGITCRCKPPRCTPHQGRFRASGDFDSRIKIYSGKSARKVGFVYIVASKTGTTKIGFSKCVLSRLSAFSSYHGALWLVRAVGMSVRRARKLEKAMHSRLFNWASNLSEWYDVPEETALAILNEELGKVFPRILDDDYAIKRGLEPSKRPARGEPSFVPPFELAWLKNSPTS